MGGNELAAHKYSAQELSAFEHEMRVSLPEDYKKYLMEVGGGESLGSKLSLLEDWCQPNSPEELPADFLSQPFPFEEAWNDLRLLDPETRWKAPYFDPLWYRGSMRIQNLGCESYRLLVVSGKERGNLWCDERVTATKGIYPLTWGRRQRATIGEFLQGLTQRHLS